MRSSALLFLAACGGGSSPLMMLPDGDVDAPVTDGAVDAAIDARPDAPPDAPPDAAPDAADEATRVEVVAYTRFGSGLFELGAIAFFRDPAGTVIKHGPVDANGMAFAYMPLGGSVIVLRAEDSPTSNFERFVRITVIHGVKPGDRLTSGASNRINPPKTGATTNMFASYTSPGFSPSFATVCGSDGGLGQNPRPITFRAGCVTQTFDVFGVGDDGTVRKILWLEDVPYVAGGTFTVPNTWQVMPTQTTTFTNVPANLTRVFAHMFAVVDGVTFESDRKGVEIPQPGTHSVSMLYAPITTPSLVLSRIVVGIQAPEAIAVVTSSPANVTVDWAALAIPRATGVQQTTTGLTWSENGVTGSPDGRTINWNSQWLDGNNVTRYASYEIIQAPTTATSYTLPSLPPAYAADDPSQHAGTLRGASVQYFDYDNLADYDAARPHGPQLLGVENMFRGVEHRARASYSP